MTSSGPRKRRRGDVLRSSFIWVSVAVVVLPFIWLVATSIKGPADLNDPLRFVFKPTWSHWTGVLSGPIASGFIVSLFIALSTVVIALIAGVPAAFAISKYHVGGPPTRLGILITQVVPPAVLVVPLFFGAYLLRLNGTVIAIIAAHLTLVVPIVTWFVIGFFDTVPKSLEEQALVDGCNRFQAFVRIVLPQVSGGIGAAAIFGFILSWNDMFYALILGGDVKTLPVVISGFNTFFRGVQIGQMSVAILVSAIPIVVLSFFIQRRLIQGISGGGVKE